MHNEKLPIKFFAPREVDELRIEGARNSEPPKWLLTGDELIQRSEELFTAFKQFSSLLNARIARKSTVPFVFVAKMCNDSTSKSRRKDISSLFRVTDKSNIIGLTDSDELVVKIDSVSQMNEISERIKDYGHNSYAISCLETFKEFKPTVYIDEHEEIYKVKLIDFQDYETNLAMQRQFEHLMFMHKIEYKKTLYASRLPVYRIKNNSKATLDTLLNNSDFEMLFSIEPMPKYVVTLDSFGNDDVLDIEYPESGQRYETLGILDNGIAHIPHLKPWMTGKRWSVYPENLIAATHGTFVAGIAMYGDKLERKDWVGHKGIKLFDAVVFPDTSKEEILEDDLIANICEAVKANHKNVKIWNLSISITREINNNKFSDFAIALDNLQEKYNILICKSAGNCTNFIKNNPKGRIYEGADSVRSLVVGSIAHDKGKYDYSEIDNPSPFSRVGPGPEYIIKPEVSHYGGNAGVDRYGKITQTGVKSFSVGGQIASNVGTSFSTPRISALATGLYQELDEDFDPLLIKGLIIHSASYPKDTSVPLNERTNQMGYGIPKNVFDIIYNDPYEATLILRDNLSKGEYIDIMDFPMPKSLIRNGYFTGQIIATLVYDPILDPTQGVEYCQSNVDIKFGSYDEKTERDINKRNILNPVGRQGSQNIFIESLYSKRIMKDRNSDFALKERLLIQYGDKYYPVKKYAVDLSELTESNLNNYATEDKNWYLTIRGLYRDNIEQRAVLENFNPSQEICLILTIRDPERKARIYDDITQGLDAFNFWHSNIKIANDISVSN